MENINKLLYKQIKPKVNFHKLSTQWLDLSPRLLAYHWFGYENRHSSQVAVQSGPLDTNVYTSSCGKQQLQNTGYKSSDWNVVNQLFKGTEFERICDEFQCYKMRVMRLWPKSMYSVHIDKSPRFHIVLSSNPGCFMMWPDSNTHVHMPRNTAWYTNTCPRHTACNSGEEYRDHIVFCSDLLLKPYKGTYERLPKDTPRGVL